MKTKRQHLREEQRKLGKLKRNPKNVIEANLSGLAGDAMAMYLESEK